MLVDANEQKNIQVVIVRDEVADQQRTINDLTRKLVEAQASLKAGLREDTFEDGKHSSIVDCGQVADEAAKRSARKALPFPAAVEIKQLVLGWATMTYTPGNPNKPEEQDELTVPEVPKLLHGTCVAGRR